MLLVLLACAADGPKYGYPDPADTDGDDSGGDSGGDWGGDSGGDSGADSGDDSGDTGGEPDDPRPVTVAFTGWVATVAGAPLGLGDEVRGSAVSGSFTWDLSVGDREISDPERGDYDHEGTGGFTVEVADLVVTGSGSPWLEVEDLCSDTFRYEDGQSVWEEPERRVMRVDGVAAPTLGLWFAITDGTGAAFSDDHLPAALPFTVEDPHTFSLDDEGGTLLIQLTTLG